MRQIAIASILCLALAGMSVGTSGAQEPQPPPPAAPESAESTPLLTPDQLELSAAAREHLAIYRRNQDLIAIGAYPAGSNAAIDEAIRLHEPLRKFLRQPVQEGCKISEGWRQLGSAMARKDLAK